MTTAGTPHDPDRLRATLCAPGGPWARLDVVERTGSTNADLVAAAGSGAGRAPDRGVLLAEHQVAGRGRRDRVWESGPESGITLSVLLRPREVPTSRWGWAPLLTGLVLVGAIERLGVAAALKWPNDLLLGPSRRKGAGILAETAPGDAADGGPVLVIGLGLNVAAAAEDLPEGATSLAAEGLDAGRDDVAVEVLTALAATLDRWRAAAGDVVTTGLAGDYRARCATLGQEVRVTAPGDRPVVGLAADLDADGRLVVRHPDGNITTVSAGDVGHVRPVGG